MGYSKTGKGYLARKRLFAKGLKLGQLTLQEIDETLPPGDLTATERWLLYYSLRAAKIEVVDANSPSRRPAAAAPQPEHSR